MPAQPHPAKSVDDELVGRAQAENLQLKGGSGLLQLSAVKLRLVTASGASDGRSVDHEGCSRCLKSGGRPAPRHNREFPPLIPAAVGCRRELVVRLRVDESLPGAAGTPRASAHG